VRFGAKKEALQAAKIMASDLAMNRAFTLMRRARARSNEHGLQVRRLLRGEQLRHIRLRVQ